MQGLAQFFEQGGTFMYVNLVVSIITMAIIVDRAIFFLGKGSVNAEAFLEQIRKLVARQQHRPRRQALLGDRGAGGAGRARGPAARSTAARSRWRRRSKRRWST